MERASSLMSLTSELPELDQYELKKRKLELEQQRLRLELESLELDRAAAAAGMHSSFIEIDEEISLRRPVSNHQQSVFDQPASPASPHSDINPTATEFVPRTLSVDTDNVEKVSNWFDNTTNVPNFNRVNDVEGTYFSIMKSMGRPKQDIMKFGGNPLEYKRFMRQFESVIVKNTFSDSERMAYLEQFTINEAQKIVSSYGYLDASRGYPAALRELEERYGDPENITNAFIRKALDWPIIKDNCRALDEFAIFLTECLYAASSAQSKGILDYSENIKRLVAKLPFHMHDRWRNLVIQAKQQERSAKFADFVEFVRKESRKLNDPVYGREALTGRYSMVDPVNPDRPRQARPLSSLVNATSVNNSSYHTTSSFNNSSRSCPCCYQNHELSTCAKFQASTMEDRVSFLKANGLCFLCFKRNHLKRDCRSNLTCSECGRRHNSIMHYDNEGDGETRVKAINGASQVKPSEHKGVGDGDGECTMAIIPVTIRVKDSAKSIQTYAFLDPGSSVTFCTSALMDRLGVRGKAVRMKLRTMNYTKEIETSVISELQLSNTYNQNNVALPRVYLTDKMPVTLRQIPTIQDVQRWAHLKDLPLVNINSDIGLLIGNNVPDAYTPLEIRTGPPGAPHAIRTRLGWVVWNVVRDKVTIEHSVNRIEATLLETDRLNELDRLVRHSMNLEFPDRICDLAEYSQEDSKFVELVEKSIRLIDGHYEIGLPLRAKTVLEDNVELAKQRLRSLAKKMLEPSFYLKYKSTMSNLIKSGYAEKVPESDSSVKGKVWYLPHHAVFHPKKPGKLRIVFDCAAQHRGVSLNSRLLQGPNLTNSLIGVLMRFRQGAVAITSDIEAMFHQVRVPTEDRNLLRFLWWPDGNTNVSPQTYRMCVHLFGATSSPSCAISALHRIVEDHGSEFNPEVSRTILRNFYVDDCLKSTDDNDEAVKLMMNLKMICLRGGFNLTKWVSNDPSVLEAIPLEDRNTVVSNLDLNSEDLPAERVLGIEWKVKSDEIGFNVLVPDRPPTRKGLLSVVSSLYDPLGLVSPYVLKAKLLLQDLCARRLSWDEAIPDEHRKKWNEWLGELTTLSQLTIPRCYKPTNFGEVTSYQLHTFSDASSVGYGVVIYLRLTNSSHQVHCSLVTSRARVAPLKNITIPRLELQAATMAARMARLVKDELEFPIKSSDMFFWTDSMTVLRYIANESKRFKVFVANRITIIRDISDSNQWNFVEGKKNPADIVSRGSKVYELLNNDQWFEGPKFLNHALKPLSHLPLSIPEDDPETLKPAETSAVTIDIDSVDPIDLIIRAFSTWGKLRKACSWILAVRNHLHMRSLSRRTDAEQHANSAPPDAEALKDAEVSIIRFVQKQYYTELIDYLKLENNTPKGSKLLRRSTLSKLDPVIIDGILRVGGRLERAELSYDMKHPIILPKESPVSRLIIEDVHRKIGHLGKNTIMSHLRERFWIVGASTVIKQVISKCVLCRRLRGSAVSQKMADLPSERLTPDEPPFSCVGVDYFGPFEVKHGRNTLKRYGVIFTCMRSRAVHLEIAHSLDADSCIDAIRRFRSRRGPVKTIWSDNGTNFIAANKELHQEMVKLSQSSTLADLNVKWIFNPPAASHFGGVWERLIRSVRRILEGLMKEQTIKLNDESLQTLFCEAESILNSRPITKISDDPNDLEALTPNHTLLFRPGRSMPSGVFVERDSYVKRRWRQVQYLADIFWKRWSREYLSLLQERQKWHDKHRNLAVGDIVLLIDETPRSSWALGKVIEIFKDFKGLVRSVKLRTKDTELRRPVVKLCLLLESDLD